MNIIYGDKKSKGEGVVDLNQIQLVYLWYLLNSL